MMKVADKNNGVRVSSKRNSQLLLSNIASQAIMYRNLMDTTELESFEKYRAETSNLSVLWTCVKAFAAITALTFPGMLFPLPPVEEGYAKETALQIFVYPTFGSLIVVYTVEHFFTKLKEHPNANPRRFLLSTFGGLAYTITVGSLSAYVCNPFPFVILVSPPYLL